MTRNPSSNAARNGARLVLILGATVALPGCDRWVVGDGVFAESVRNVSSFTGVEVENGIQVSVSSGAADQSVRVSGDENVLQYVKTSVEGRALGPTLTVKTTVRHVESTHPLLVTVEVPSFDHVEADDGSRVSVTNASADTFTVAASEGANVELAGSGGAHLDATVWGSARLDARSWVAGDARVALDDGGEALLHVDGDVTGTVGSRAMLENEGEGPCDVTSSSDATVQCPP